VDLDAPVGHRVDGEGDAVVVRVRLPRGGVDAAAGDEAGQDDLRDAAAAELGVQVGAVEGTPLVLGDADVGVLGAEFVDDDGEVGGQALLVLLLLCFILVLLRLFVVPVP